MVDRLYELKAQKLSLDSRYETRKGKNPQWWIEFKVDSISQPFRLQFITFDCSNTSQILSDFRKDSVISLFILKKDLQEISLTADDSDYLFVYDISKGDNHYVDLNCYNEKADNDVWLSISLVCFCGLLSLYLGKRKYQLVLFGEEFKPIYLLLLALLALALSNQLTIW